MTQIYADFDYLERFKYVPTEHAGVYVSQQEILEPVRLILLNELSDAPHNAFFKCFASREKEKRRAFDILRQQDFSQFPKELYWLISGLFNKWFESEGELMDAHTPEKVIEMGKMWWSHSLFKILPPKEVLSHYRPEEVFSHYRPEEVLSHYRPEEVLGQYKPEEVLGQYKPEEVLGQYKPEERVAGLKPEERVAGLKPEERMADLSIEELEAYILQRQKESTRSD
ncbi:MAG: hypothetical protein ACPGWR_10925 [Ardenticatenaceae bacterium]